MSETNQPTQEQLEEFENFLKASHEIYEARRKVLCAIIGNCLDEASDEEE